VRDSPKKQQKSAKGLRGSYIKKITDFYLFEFTTIYRYLLFS